MNKPSSSLSSIFRSWMPQTSTKLEHRQSALKVLANKHPAIAWPICIEQFSQRSRVGHYSHKPRWRPEGRGKGSPITQQEANAFSLYAFRLALDWSGHTLTTIGDLVRNLDGVDETLHDEVWDVVDRWIASANAEEKADLREQIRVSTLTRRARRHAAKGEAATETTRAKKTFERLEPSDPVLRHGWLFRDSWVQESADEVMGDDYDDRARDARIAKLRAQAVAEVFTTGGAKAVLRLAQRGQAAHTVGCFLAQVLDDRGTLVEALAEIANEGDLSGARGLIIEGALLKAADEDDRLLRVLASRFATEKWAQLLMLAPFEGKTWRFVDELSDEVQKSYWTDVKPRWSRDPADLTEAVKRLIAARRPRAAFQHSRLDRRALPAPLLYALLVAILTNSTEAANTYMLDPHSLRKAFELLNDSGEITSDQIASLEFQFIDIFRPGKDIPINLSKIMAAQPEYFVQAVAFFTKRKDDRDDPPELKMDDEEARSNRATAAYKLLEAVVFIPGVADDVIEAARIVAWVEQARSSLSALARQDIGDQMIGQLLAKAPAAEDKIWPCLPVRDALEQVANHHISVGVQVSLRNARGAHWRGEGGAQERELAAQYRGWADAMAYTHPRVAAILRGVEKAYLSEAEWQDNDAKIARRIQY